LIIYNIYRFGSPNAHNALQYISIPFQNIIVDIDVTCPGVVAFTPRTTIVEDLLALLCEKLIFRYFRIILGMFS